MAASPRPSAIPSCIPPNGGDAELGDKIGVFAKRLLDAAPARIAGDVDHRPQRLMNAAGARLRRRHLEQTKGEFRIERRG